MFLLDNLCCDSSTRRVTKKLRATTAQNVLLAATTRAKASHVDVYANVGRSVRDLGRRQNVQERCPRAMLVRIRLLMVCVLATRLLLAILI